MPSSSSYVNSRKWGLRFVSILMLFFLNSSFSFASSSSSSAAASYYLHQVIANTTALHQNFTAISEFRTINRRRLEQCNSEDSIQISVAPNSSLSDDGFVTLTVSGVSNPSDGDWVAMISPSNSSVKSCFLDGFYYIQTGDTATLPLLCH